MVAEHDGVELHVTKWYDNKAGFLQRGLFLGSDSDVLLMIEVYFKIFSGGGGGGRAKPINTLRNTTKALLQCG